MGKLDQIRALREARHAEKSLTNPRPETAKTTKAVVNVTDETTKSVVQTDGVYSDTTKSVVVLPDDFRALMDLAQLTQKRFAELTGTPLRTVEDWSRGASPAPPIAKAWLRLYCETG